MSDLTRSGATRVGTPRRSIKCDPTVVGQDATPPGVRPGQKAIRLMAPFTNVTRRLLSCTLAAGSQIAGWRSVGGYDPIPKACTSVRGADYRRDVRSTAARVQLRSRRVTLVKGAISRMAF